ncbi:MULTISPECIES: hypothetical protein [Rhodomicrobium]|uniref:hypothetical protein n=1 Tax=Rhodomicrobium TaxID=1068 RepID=UPI000B4AEB92|nr:MULTISPECIES: hypothetical protein [Rhodomicrobium]
MMVRSAILVASLFMAGQALAADNSLSGHRLSGHPQAAAAAAAGIAPAGLGDLADVGAEGGPTPHAQELKRIAIYNAIGNRDSAEILSAQIGQFGVTRDEIDEAVTWTRLHGGSGSGPAQRQTHIEFGANAPLATTPARY